MKEVKKTNIQSYDSTISIAQPEDVKPECEPDEEFDADVTCATPIKYIKQKWLFRRNREVRYQVDKISMRRFDERRLVDMRFWMFMGIVGNIANQLPNTFTPMTPEQYNLNL